MGLLDPIGVPSQPTQEEHLSDSQPERKRRRNENYNANVHKLRAEHEDDAHKKHDDEEEANLPAKKLYSSTSERRRLVQGDDNNDADDDDDDEDVIVIGDSTGCEASKSSSQRQHDKRHSQNDAHRATAAHEAPGKRYGAADELQQLNEDVNSLRSTLDQCHTIREEMRRGAAADQCAEPASAEQEQDEEVQILDGAEGTKDHLPNSQPPSEPQKEDDDNKGGTGTEITLKMTAKVNGQERSMPCLLSSVRSFNATLVISSFDARLSNS